MTLYSNGIGNELGQGLSLFAQQFLGTQNTLQQQAEQRAQVAADNAFRQQQAAEQTRQFDANFNYRRDADAWAHLDAQRQELIKNLQSGAYEKDPLLKARAVQLLGQNKKYMDMAEKGLVPSQEDSEAYDKFYQDFADVTGLGAASLGVNAAARDDALTRTQVNAATLSDFDVTYTRDTLPKKIAGFNAIQDREVLQTNILAAIAPFQTAAGKAQALQTIAAAGGTSAGVVQDMLTSGLIDPDTVAALKTRMGEVDITNAAGAVVAQGQADLMGFSVHNAARDSSIADKYADRTAAATTRGLEIQADLGEMELAKVKAIFDTTIRSINDKNTYDSALTAVQTGLLKPMSVAMQVKYLSDIAAAGGIGAQAVQTLVDGGDLDPEVAAAVKAKAGRVDATEQAQLDILLNQAAITDNDRQISDATLQNRIDLFKSNTDLAIKTNLAELDLLKFKTPAQRAAYLQSIAKLGTAGLAILDGLKDSGVITQQQAAVFKVMAGNTQKVEDAGVRTAVAGAEGAEVGVQTARFNLDSARQLFPTQLASAQTALASAQQQLDEARKGAPYRLDILKANLATLNQDLTQNAALFGPRLQQAQLQVQQLASEVRVLEATEQGRISTVNSGAKTAAAQATSAAAQATVDVATIPAQIASRNLAPQQAQAALTAQLNENRFADATFASRVKALDLSNSTATQQLLALKQQYSQNATRFPAELDYLKAQISVMEANAKESAAKALDATGNGVTDKKSMLQALDSMRKINADDRRLQATNLQNTLRRLLPNARFSIDKYDSKSFTQLVASASGLTDDQKAELSAAQLGFETANSKATDLSTAIGSVAGNGRIDPKIAERLGIFSPGGAGTDTSFVTPGKPSPKGAPIAPNIPQGTVTGKGGVVFSGGGAQAVQSLLPPAEITKQIGMTVDAYLSKVKQQGGNTNPWDNAAGPVRAYNGLRPSADNQIRYVNDVRAAYDAKPWVQAISDATGQRKAELQLIDSEADRIAKARGVDPNVIKAIMWQESMGWQPGIPSSDGKGGGLGQVTGYFPPKGGTYSSTAPVGSGASGPATQNPASTPANPTATSPQSNGPLVSSTARPLILAAKTPGELDAIKTRLIAGGMKPEQAVTFIRGVFTNERAASGASPAVTDVQGMLAAKATSLAPFYAAVRKAPNTQAAQKLLHDRAIVLAGGPNAPQELKARYFDALLAAAKQ